MSTQDEVTAATRASEPLKIFGEHEAKVIAQLQRCVDSEDGALGVLCADGHYGYGAPVGGVMAYREHTSPAGVGYDIGCGNMAVETSLLRQEIVGDEAEIMDRIEAEIDFGMGGQSTNQQDHPVLDAIRTYDDPLIRELYDKAARQLGSVGGGNHYVDLFEDEETGRVWVGVHFGSRGFGHTVGNGYMSIAAGKHFKATSKDSPEEAPPLLRLDSDAGADYMAAMELAGEYAYAGRERVVNTVLGILDNPEVTFSVHNHHNYAWREQHHGEQFVVVRKGATPAFAGQKGFVGATMGESAVILEGAQAQGESIEALFSTVHGAGRAMSRNAAKGKSRKRWTCLTRDCDWVQPPRTQKPSACPECGTEKLTKRWVRETEGAIDWQAALADLEAKGIELRGAAADEAPGAYKRLDEVLGYHGNTVNILSVLRPFGVAMAPSEVPADD